MKYLIFLTLFFSFQFQSMAAVTPVQELDYIVAVINDEVLTRTELDKRTRMIKQQLGQKGARLPDDATLRKQILERMIQERLQLQLAKRMGIRVDDETVTRVLDNIAKENGLSLGQFRQKLEQSGLPYNEFRENIHNEIVIDRVRKRQVEEKVNVTQQEVENQLANMNKNKQANEEYRLSHILIATPEAPTPADITKAEKKARAILGRLQEGSDFAAIAIAESDGQQALKGGDLGWLKAGQLPTLFSDQIGRMQKGELGDIIRSPSGFHIFKLEDVRHQEERHVVKQTLARHILISTNTLRSDSEARALLQRIRAEIQEGQDFALLAREYSNDKGSAGNGGDLGWVNPGQTVPAFQREMDALAPGAISEPFRTQFGWHIVQVLSRRQQDNTELFRSQQARQLIRKRKINEAVISWIRQLRDEAYVEVRLDQ